MRVLLSRMMIQASNVLILDEPTDHLDMESITALNNGLIKFPVLYSSLPVTTSSHRPLPTALWSFFQMADSLIRLPLTMNT